MRIISVKGSQQFDDWDLENLSGENYKAVLYDYHIDWYEGEGQAICVLDENICHVYDLSHCSCYGPLESNYTITTLDALFNSDNIHDTDFYSDELKKLVNDYKEGKI